MYPCITRAIHNIRGGLLGVLVYLGITVIIVGVAFMAAFGNDTPTARFILAAAGIYFRIAFPLWGIPVSYVLGGIFFSRDAECKEQSEGKGWQEAR
ncbi:hypothetical protein ASZ90_016351 [hydrocarbon metagenome]|uniref:Uncharacterized protein n=1 Tax=hydrocarbon metagenome TaxID=938273 RepID=A0A0W8EYC9_9ZZZZ